jgi:microcystin-dependent protein
MWDDAFLGEIKMFAGTYAPVGYALCYGQILPISQNAALFSILGTTYGGNGVTNFALPDFRGRTAIGAGTGPGTTQRYLGDVVGAESAPQAVGSVVTDVTSTDATLNVQRGTAVVAQNQAAATIPTVPPSLAINYIICINGIYPSRDY